MRKIDWRYLGCLAFLLYGSLSIGGWVFFKRLVDELGTLSLALGNMIALFGVIREHYEKDRSK